MSRSLVILYSHDEEQWKERLKSQVAVLIKAGEYKIHVDAWCEKRFQPGDDWYPDLESALNQADLIILMVSEIFLVSPFMQSEKVKERLRSKQKGGFPIFVVLLSKCGWRRFTWLKNLPVWPGRGKYLSDLGETAVEDILADATEKIAGKLKLKANITQGTLSFLSLNGVGPAKDLVFGPGRRLNIITGDNGYGKSFLMECAWWALAGVWPKIPVLPGNDGDENQAKIHFQLTSKSGTKGEIQGISYDGKKKEWPRTIESVNECGLVIYARADGSFTLWDPVRGKIKPPRGYLDPESPLIFKHLDMVFNGIKEKGETGERFLCNGLVADWTDWQKTPGSPFEIFEKVLEKLSCSQQEPLLPGKPLRIPGDTRPIPSLKYPYGDVPIIHTASSVQRIVSLAYLIIYTWNEHKLACKEEGDMYKNMIILLDELESHLHPQWQRTIIPSLLEVKKSLDRDSELDIQFFITTHSPLVLASLEPFFDEVNDRLFHLELDTAEINLKERSFLPHGRVDNWFTSEVIGLSQARSLEAEKAVEAAQKIQREDNPTKKEVMEVHKLLARYLGDFDTFWPHWIYFAEKISGEKL